VRIYLEMFSIAYGVPHTVLTTCWLSSSDATALQLKGPAQKSGVLRHMMCQDHAVLISVIIMLVKNCFKLETDILFKWPGMSSPTRQQRLLTLWET
jgi:hypothetical protein